MTIIVVTGTGTDVGKTVVTAALASCARAHGVAVVKPAQTGVLPGELGDLAEVARLAGVTDVHQFARYPDPLSPHHAAARAGLAPLDRDDTVRRIGALAEERDLVIVEGAGGVLVPFDRPGGWTVLDLARDLGADIVLVTRPGLGTLSDTRLAIERIGVADVVVGWWPDKADLAMRCNLPDLAAMSRDGRLAGVLPAGAAGVEDFDRVARASLAPRLGGAFHAPDFLDRHRP